MAFAKSSNIGAYKVARPLNRSGFHSYAQKFGFGSKTGIELNAEQSGWMSEVESWSKPSFSSRTMGYEVSVTPMQMVMACSVIANGGVYQPPTIIESVREGATHDVQILKGDMKAARRVLSAKAGPFHLLLKIYKLYLSPLDFGLSLSHLFINSWRYALK